MDKSLEELVGDKIEQVMEKTLKNFEGRLTQLLVSVVSGKLANAGSLLSLEEDLLEELSSRNIAGLSNAELLSLMERIEKLIHASVDYLEAVKLDVKGIVGSSSASGEFGMLKSLTPQEREQLRVKAIEEIQKMLEVKGGKEDNRVK